MSKLKMTKEIKPWERQEGESQRSFEAFCTYRDMGRDRTVNKVAQLYGRSHITFDLLSQKWRWVERSKAWMDDLDRRKREAIIKEVQEMAKRHAKQAMVMQRVLFLPSEAILKRLNTNPLQTSDFDGISTSQLFDKAIDGANAFCKVVDIERKSRGEPNEIMKQDLLSGGERIKVIIPQLMKQDHDN